MSAAALEYMQTEGVAVSLPSGIPETLDAFIALRDQVATTPDGGALMFIVAMYVYTNVEKALGAQFLCVSIDAEHVKKADTITESLRAPVAVKGYVPSAGVLRDMDARCGAHSNPKYDKSHVARSYFEGTSPDAQYALPAARLSIRVKRQSRDAANPGRLFVVSSGADLPKPIQLQRNQKGIWKASSWSSLQASVRPPKVLLAREQDEI